MTMTSTVLNPNFHNDYNYNNVYTWPQPRQSETVTEETTETVEYDENGNVKKRVTVTKKTVVEGSKNPHYPYISYHHGNTSGNADPALTINADLT